MSYEVVAGRDQPVQDWATDFDHADPDYNPNTFEIWKGLRSNCPVAHTDRYGGTWLPVTHADVTRVAYDAEVFSNCGPLVSTLPPVNPPASMGLTPLSCDPPYHTPVRRPILPYFSPKSVNAMESDIRSICVELLDNLGDAAHIDGALDYDERVSTLVTAKVLGFPREDADKIRHWVKDGFEGVNHPLEERMARGREQEEYLDQLIEQHRRQPQNDVVTYLIDNAKLDGQPWTQERIRANVHLILVAGVDTTWSSIGSSIWHLAQHPEQVARLVDEPALWPNAIEELLRVYAPLTMGRKVTKDVDFNGCPMKAGDWVLLPYPAANIDPSVWGEDATEVQIDRVENRNYTFGL